MALRRYLCSWELFTPISYLLYHIGVSFYLFQLHQCHPQYKFYYQLQSLMLRWWQIWVDPQFTPILFSCWIVLKLELTSLRIYKCHLHKHRLHDLFSLTLIAQLFSLTRMFFSTNKFISLACSTYCIPQSNILSSPYLHSLISWGLRILWIQSW